jgi:hypothetical protein
VKSEAHTASGVLSAVRFLRARFPAVVIISAVLLVPCFWHSHIEAGDLASHTYNAWLAQLIERGQVPGLYISSQFTNILADVALARLGGALGFGAAEKMVVGTCVLIFFWGAFALIVAATRQLPWFLIPAIAMLAYGWTFEMGFLNYYLSLGLGFLAIALLWRGHGIDWIAGAVLAGLTLLAHPMGSVCVVAIVFYIRLAERMNGSRRWSIFGAAFLAVFVAHVYIVHHFRAQYWDTPFFYAMNGADQLVLFGGYYAKLAAGAVVFGICCFFVDLVQRKVTASQWRCRTALELWSILLFTAAMIPELIQLSQYASPVGFVVSRLTSVTAVMGLCILGSVSPKKWHLIGLSTIAAVFFLLLFIDTGTVNRMEAQADRMVSELSYGRRVIAKIEAPRGWRVGFISHIVDRACVGHCFAYANYEASSGHFRIRASHGNSLVTDSPEASHAMEAGEYVARPEDLPMTEIYQCDDKDWRWLCMRNLVAGEKNGGVGRAR